MEVYLVALMTSFAAAIAITPLVVRFAHKCHFVDHPDERKVHKEAMPRIGGLTFIFGMLAGLIFLTDVLVSEWRQVSAIAVGAALLVAVGLLDDRFVLRARSKVIVQIAAASIVAYSGVVIDFIAIPFGERVDLGFLSYMVTVLWFLAVMNSMNLIDGLDGLAAGIAIIACLTMLVIAVGNPTAYGLVLAIGVTLIGSTGGFLVFNFHPAKLFMGDTGSLFLGYMIAVMSILGFFKTVTMVSLVVPLLILGVPMIDTMFAIIRRTLNQQKIAAPDKGHLHHCLLARGYGHRKAVLLMYGVSILFAMSALLLSKTGIWLSLFVLVVVATFIQLFAEFIGLIGDKRQPLLTAIRKWVQERATLRSK
ncbi:MraY family glycosyltransferase [Shouchella shacheensis]|uniref:MraY family glycosyltransferase n=1 Tax=Shouchella shacheensis TaxID=1649580 RepID=UPI0007403C64|nr:MraY family glycosyltransferase [Shouchella shacheensis]